VRDSKAVPGAVVAIQTFGDFLGFHPHLHILVIRFREVSLEESLSIARKEKQDLDRFRLRWAPRDRTEKKRSRSPVRKTKKKKAG